MPTEDEWEWACRGGNPGRFCYGDDAGYAPYFATCNGVVAESHTVGRHMPNWYGLFDMHGGLWEWTDSVLAPARLPPHLEHPQSVKLFVLRGGAYNSPAVRCRSTQANASVESGINRYFGVRLVMEVGQP